jgi:hypothetical protein
LSEIQRYLKLLNALIATKELIKMSSQTECPICMEEIVLTKNCVTTECGHCFHTNCLMTSVAHNGFACPYCRAAMAQAVNDDDDEYADDDDDDSLYNFEDNEDALRGFRFFFNNINSEEPEEADVAAEDVMNAYQQELVEQQRAIPSIAIVTQKLVEQGVTLEQLVKSLLLDHEEYESDDSLERTDDELFGKVRIIISNYTPEPVFASA